MAVPAVGSSRAVETEQLHEQTEGHLDEEEAPPAPPAATQPRPFSARSFGTRRGRAPHTARRPERRAGEHFQDQDPGEGHAQGVPDFPGPLPGFHHYADHELVLPHRPLDVGPADPYYSKGMAHGVALEEIHHGGRPTAKPEDRAGDAATRQLVEEETAPKVDPVPVYIVERGAGARPLKRAALRQVIVPAPGADPIVLAPRNPHRSSVRVLNESTNPVRLLADLAAIGGALLPANMTSYLEIDTEDEICAYVPAGTGGTTVTAQGDVTSPGASATIAAIAAGSLTPGQLYIVTVTVNLAGTVTQGTDNNNIKITANGTSQANLGNDITAGPQPFGPFQIIPQGTGITVATINAGTAGSIYSATVSATPYDPAVGNGAAAISVIEQYDVAGGT